MPDPKWDSIRPIRSEKQMRLAALIERGGPYDPRDIGETEIMAALGKLARRRTLGTASYLKSVGRQH